MNNLTVSDFDNMNLTITSVSKVGRYIVLQLQNGARLMFKDW